MGKVKKVVMDEGQEAVVKAKAVSNKKSMVIWEELYTDLTPRVAEALRQARVKPDQLTGMSDGEITAIEGIGEVGLEEIRTKYLPAVALAKEGAADPNPDSEPSKPATPSKPRHSNRRGKKIRAMASKVDRTKLYPVAEAVQLVKATNITSFDATLTLHLNLVEKISRVEVTFPFLAGPAKKVAIADDKLLEQIDKGILDFDILLATPAMMPKLAKHARLLGPKGLMPSPKAGTVTADPEGRAKEFVSGKTVVKGESKFPLMHVVVGKVSQKEEELVANLEAVITAVKPKNIEKAVLSSTMSPGIKLQTIL